MMFLVGVLAAALASAATLPRPGDYLDITYIQALAKTGSPLLAGRDDTMLRLPQMITVQAAGAGRRVALTYGWREGALLLDLARNGAMRRAMAWGHGPGLALRMPGGDALCLASAAATQQHCYRYVGNATRFISSAVLAGRYVDRQGQSYQFAPDGAAHFPGFDFHYAVMLDQASDPYDFFQIDGTEHYIAFRREGALLTLFAVGPPKRAGFGTPDFGRPLAVLRALPVRLARQASASF